MSSYIAEGIRYFRIAKNHCGLTEDNHENVFVSIIFSALYIESILNEIIFTNHQYDEKIDNYP